MKTKISHLGRSSVSVILAVMMLLSTMLIGTVSTVNAVTKKFDSVNLVGDINGNVKWNSTDYPFTFDENTGYWNLDITFTKKSIFKARVNNSWDKSFGDSNGNDYVISDNEIGDYTISIKDDSPDKAALTVVKKTVKKVADSVTLTASSSPVQVGTEVTLTATLNKKATGLNDADVTYKFERTNGDEVTGSTTEENTYKFTPATAGDYRFKVTASAKNYTSVTNTVTVTATSDSSAETTQPVTSDYYFWYSTDSSIANSEKWQQVPMTKNGSNYYVSNLSVNSGGNFYFIVNKDANIPYRNTVWNTGDDVKVDCTACKNLSRFGPQSYNVPGQSAAVCYYYISVQANGSYSFTFDGNKTVTVTEGSIQPPDPTETVKITVPTVENAIVTATANSITYSEGKSFDIEVGSSFTVDVTGENGYTLNKITYGTQSKTETGANFTAESGAKTFSVVMNPPVSDPTVTFKPNNSDYGTVSATNGTTSLDSPATVKVGDEVTFTAAPKPGYTFTGWTVTVNGTPKTYTKSSLPLTITADTTVVANFKETTGTLSKYYLLCGEDATFQTGNYTSFQLYDDGNGTYYADFDIVQNSIPKDKDYYIIFSTKEDNSGIIVESSNVKVNSRSGNGFSLYNNNGGVHVGGPETKSATFAKVFINSDSDVTGFTIKITDLDLNNNNKKITYSAEPKFKETPKNAVNIFAKNGTQTAKFQEMGTTEITKDDGVLDIVNYDDKGYTKKATAIKGNKVTVTTTVADDYKDTYYVKGFVVNGESYGIQSGPNETGVYTLEYQIPDDVEDGTNFEITPVYFLKDSQNCVTFYVEGFDGAVQDSWGNTIACYPYYEDQSGTTNNNAFGAYPGQPLLYEGGKYYTQIPKSITLGGVDKKIVGMTLNNFALESVHGAISTIQENKQSYDYDDFVRIANNDYGNNIIYTFKYSTVKDNFDGLAVPTVSPNTITKDEFDSPTGNGWEDLTDYNHRKVDLFGNVLTDTDSKKDPLLVVSNGYFENYQGYYATEWTVYEHKNGTYSKIAQIPSSALLLKSKDDLTDSTSDNSYLNSLSSYANAYETLKASCRNTPAQITFESSIKRGRSLQGRTNPNAGNDGESAYRVDGRWYYSMLGEKITAKIAVEYGDTATSSFKDDPFEGDTNKTTTIGTHAYFTNDDASGQTTYNSRIDSSKYFTFTADTIATDKDGQNYVFLGWYLLSDNKYTKLTDAKAPMTGSDTFVARYVKAPKGTVTIDHKLFSAASNPTPPTTQTPGTGSGKCYVTVKVLDENNQPIKKFDETEGSVTLDGTYIDSTKDYKLEITLKTVTSGLDEFQKFYYLAQDKQTYNSIDTGTTTTTAEGKVTTVTRTVKILDSFFNHNDDGTYTFRNETGSDSIHYYSDIKETKIPYKITFNYKPRLESDAKQYVVTGEFTSEYILKYGAKLTPEFVMSVAPYEDNFFKTIKWDKDNITIDNKGTTAVVNSTISPRTVTVTALDVNGVKIKAYELNAGELEFTSTVVYGSLLTYDNLCGLTPDEKTKIANGREYIYVAEPVHNGEKFSYWQISTSSDMNDKSAYVTKCFSKEFNYIAYNHYYIWPVYGKSQSITGASTTLNFLDYSRNQSTDPEGNKKTDRVFADFALAFDSNGIQLKTYNGDNIKVGMFLEVCGDLETDSTGNVITDIDQYKDKPEYITSETDLKEIKRVILEGSTTKNLTYTTVDGITRKLLNKPIDINSLDNKNRIEYYVGYNNNDNNQKKLMRAYSYVIVGDEITLCSTPYSFVNYYKVGNKTYTV